MPGWLLSFLEIQTPLLLVVLLRLLVGAELVAQGYDKFRQGYVGKPRHVIEGQDHRLASTLKVWMEYEATIYRTGPDGQPMRKTIRMFPWYKVFLEKAVLPNVKVFATLVTVAELALGAMLILGLLTRVVAAVGVLLLLSYLFGTWHYGFPYPAFNILFLGTLVVIGLANVGRCLGFDQALHERFPEIPLF